MSEGPTTAGSIVGKLKLDKTQWDADVAAAKADARELGALEPTIRVDAKIGDAVAKLEAVRAAEGGVDNSNKQMAASTNVTINRMALIAGAIAILLPMLPALAGYSVGVAGALAGMGAAGVLAIFGVRNAMAEGTAAGNTFSAGLQLLKGDFNELANTAAGSMLSAFTQSISTINAYMPALNEQIGVFGKQLGIASNFLLTGVLKAFEVLNPLFVQAGVYVEQLALGFQKWTQGGGLQQFTQMAIASLPQVAAALGSLVKGTLDLVTAFAPLGTILLSVITVLGQLLTFIAPILGALTPLAVAAGVVYGAFLLWKQISPTIEKVRTSVRGFGLDLSAMGGVAGLAVAALGFIASSFATARMASVQAAQALEDYTAAVEQDNGVIGENVRLQTAKALADKNSLGNYNSLGKSAIDIGRQLGLSAKTVEDASNGQHDAILKVNQAMTDYAANPANSTAKVAAFRANWNNLTGVIGDNQKQIRGAIKAYNDIAAAQGATTISTKAELQAQQDLASRYGMSLPQMLAAEGAQKQNADAAANTTRQLQLENDAAGLLTNAFTLLNGGTLSVAQAQTGAAAATNSLIDSFKQNGVVIDGNTKAAVANQQAIQQKVAADQQSAEAIAKQTGSTEAGTKAFADSKVALENQLKAQGLLNPVVQAYIDKLYAIPPVAKTQVELDAAAALASLAHFQALMAGIPRSFTVTANVASGTDVTKIAHPGQADGGTIGMSAGGSVRGPGTASSDTAGLYRLANGEEVISNKSGQADKWRPLLKDINAGRNPSFAQAQPVIQNHYQTFQIYEATNGEQLAQKVANRTNRRAAV